MGHRIWTYLEKKRAQFTIISIPGGIEALHCTQQTLQVNTKFGQFQPSGSIRGGIRQFRHQGGDVPLQSGLRNAGAGFLYAPIAGAGTNIAIPVAARAVDKFKNEAEKKVPDESVDQEMVELEKE